MGKIVGVGSVLVDLTGFAADLPVGGQTIVGKIRLGAGGKGSNQMTAANRAGSEAVIISRVGNDVLSEIPLRHLKNDGMTLDYITVAEGETTAAALIEIDTKTAQNRIVVDPAACLNITAEDVRKAEKEFESADIVLVQLETSIESILEAKRLAKQYGKPFVVNPAPYVPMPEGFYDGVDYATPNETETEALTGIRVDDDASAVKAGRALLAMGIKNAVITLGENGAMYVGPEREIKIDGIKVDAIETTGAGDAFNGGFVTALAEELDIETALKFANCTAAISVTRLGSGPAMPERCDILELLYREYGIKL